MSSHKGSTKVYMNLPSAGVLLPYLATKPCTYVLLVSSVSCNIANLTV